MLVIIIVSVTFRLTALGYSDFQGDEVSVQNFLFGEEKIIPFILSRTVGPAQYLIAYVANLLADSFHIQKEVFVRLPFALAGVLAVFAMYKLSKKFFDESVALISTMLFSISGLYIAFSRIVQYQSFVILLSLVTVFIALSHLKIPSNKKLLLLGLFSGISLLFHYDSLSFILPVYLVLALQNTSIKEKIRSLLYASAPLFTIVGMFYIPFVLQPNFKSTLLYLANERIRSEFNFDSLYYSARLMGIYHPKEYLVFLLLVLVLLVLYLFRNAESVFQKSVLTILTLVIVLRIYNEFTSTPLIYFSVTLSILYFLGLVKKAIAKDGITAELFVTLWFSFAFISYGLLFQKPLTHIYNFLTPLFILLGISVTNLPLLTKRLILTLLVVVGLTSLSFNYQAFIDTTPEYPWNEKDYVTGSMSTSLADNQAVMGVFGFPYRRNWSEIGKKLHELGITKYRSNEKYRLSKYYVQGIAWDDFDFEVFVWIDRPQSFDRQPRPTQDVLAEGHNYAIYKYTPPLLYDTNE